MAGRNWPPTRTSRSPRWLTNDDVAVQDSLYTAGPAGRGCHCLRGRRSPGAALAEEGAGLGQGRRGGRREVNERSRSLGVALSSCTCPRGPGQARPSSWAASPRFEMGIGIHGEPGRTRGPRLAPARGPRRRPRLDAIGRWTCRCPGDLLVMVNGMGGNARCWSCMWLFNEVQRYLEGQGARIRQEPGGQTTSPAWRCRGLFSVTVCQLTETNSHRLWDAPVDTPALRWGTLASTVLPERRAKPADTAAPALWGTLVPFGSQITGRNPCKADGLPGLDHGRCQGHRGAA